MIVPLKTLINIEEEKQKLINDKEKVLLEIRRATNVTKSWFCFKSSKGKVEAEKTKLENYQQQLLELEKLLQELG